MTIFGITVSMSIVWIVLAVIFAVIEAITISLTTIWFAGGAIAAMAVALADGAILAQIIVFIIVSIILLVLTRPIVKKKLKTGSETTNIDALIGKDAKVMKDIKPFDVGEVRINGLVWSAVSQKEGVCIQAGTEVVVKGVEGVKLIVTPIDAQN